MKIRTSFSLFLVLCLFISCKKDNASVDLLKQAETVVESDPQKALALLDSIPVPQNMDTDHYMKYIVRRVQAKYKMYQDVSGDTLIFEASKYFDDKNNSSQAALANFYAGCVNREMKRYDKSLKYFLKSSEDAKKIGDEKLSGQVFDYIGSLYLGQGLMDSSIINYKKAVNYFDTEKDSVNILRVTNQIGRAYEDIGGLDSAYVYFNKALQLAASVNDRKYINYITINLGLTSFGMGKFDEAVAYFQSALNMEVINETQVKKINLLLLKSFTAKNDLNSAKQYAVKVEASLPEVADPQTKKKMYAALTYYYKQQGDYKQALQFSELESEAILQIAKEERPVEMIKAETKFRAAQQDEVYEKLQTEFYIYTVGGIVIIIVTILLFIFAYKHNKKEKEEMRLQVEKYRRAREYLASTKGDYDKIEAQLKALREDLENDKDDT